MGRRRSKRKPETKKKILGTLETQFTCPFCNHTKSCDVKMLVFNVVRGIKMLVFNVVRGIRRSLLEVMNFTIYRDRVRNLGFVQCRVCLEDYQTTINCKFK